MAFAQVSRGLESSKDFFEQNFEPMLRMRRSQREKLLRHRIMAAFIDLGGVDASSFLSCLQASDEVPTFLTADESAPLFCSFPL